MRQVLLVFAILCVAGGAIPATAQEPQPPYATVQVRVLDVYIQGVRKLGFGFRGADGAEQVRAPLVTKLGKTEELLEEQLRRGGFFTYSKNDASYALVDALCKRKLATVVEDTTLKVTIGREGGFTKGGFFEVPDDTQADGMKTVKYDQAEIMATVIPHEDRALVSFKVRLTDLDHSGELKGKGRAAPALKVFEASSTVETKWGSTATICYPTRREKIPGFGNHDQELQRLVLITPSPCEELPTEVAHNPEAAETIIMPGGNKLPGQQANVAPLMLRRRFPHRRSAANCN